MKVISEEDYSKLIEGARLLEADGHGPKVFLTVDKKICKLFRTKRTFSSALLYPYAQRFADNAAALVDKKIPCVNITGVFNAPHISRNIVIYDFMEGETLRDVLREDFSMQLIEQLAGFIARLHQQGVYFRSLHFGNVVIMPSQEFGLIDVSDMKVSKKSLGLAKRVRNFKAMMRYEEDVAYLDRYGFDKFINLYLQESGISKEKFHSSLKLQPGHPAAKLLL